jgi:hypothetical protein
VPSQDDVGVDLDEVRHQLVVLCRRPRSRRSEFQPNLPCDWRPHTVLDPDGYDASSVFSDAGAWDLIASRVEAGEPLEIVLLDKPPGARGYVMKFRLHPEHQLLYVKVQLGAGIVLGRSFHYSKHSTPRGKNR